MKADSGKIFLEDELGRIPSAKKVMSIIELGKEKKLEESLNRDFSLSESAEASYVLMENASTDK